MKNPFTHPAMTDISLFLARLTLGLFMLMAGWRKFSQAGVAKFAEVTVGMRPDWLPEGLARAYGYALPFAELLGGLLLVFGLFTRWAGGVLALVLVSIFVAVVSANGLTGGEKNQPIHYSIVLAMLAFVLAIVGPGRLALDPLYFGGGRGGAKKTAE